MTTHKNKQKQNKTKKTPKERHTEQNKTKDKREGEWEMNKKSYPPNPNHFSEWFFSFSLPVSSSKSLEHNPVTLLKLCYLLDGIFS